jgi:hypothetical protein
VTAVLIHTLDTGSLFAVAGIARAELDKSTPLRDACAKRPLMMRQCLGWWLDSLEIHSEFIAVCLHGVIAGDLPTRMDRTPKTRIHVTVASVYVLGTGADKGGASGG